MRIVGYAYEAATHCPRCHDVRAARGGFGHGPEEEDSEGNPVHPIFDHMEDIQEGDECDTCGECME